MSRNKRWVSCNRPIVGACHSVIVVNQDGRAFQACCFHDSQWSPQGVFQRGETQGTRLCLFQNCFYFAMRSWKFGLAIVYWQAQSLFLLRVCLNPSISSTVSTSRPLKATTQLLSLGLFSSKPVPNGTNFLFLLKPSWYIFRDAWTANKGLSKEQAMADYIKLVDDGDKDWENSETMKNYK